MKKKGYFPLVATITVLVLSIVGGIGKAAEYPNKTITLISPFAPGGMMDAIVRPFAALAEKRLGVPMVMVNKPGATTIFSVQRPKRSRWRMERG